MNTIFPFVAADRWVGIDRLFKYSSVVRFLVMEEMDGLVLLVL